jgi:hypothetical protein
VVGTVDGTLVYGMITTDENPGTVIGEIKQVAQCPQAQPHEPTGELHQIVDGGKNVAGI